MRLLLDTHVFLWFIVDEPRLPAVFREAVRDPGNDVFLSVASVWEVVVKFGLGKLPLPEPPEIFLPRERERHEIETLAVEEPDLVHLAKLPPLHRDPFDRIIIAQALRHDLTLLTVDDAVRGYPVELFTS